jgi:hypothetical protein
MNISKDAEKSFDKIPHPFLRKADELGTERTLINIIKDLYNKTISHIILNIVNLSDFFYILE